MQRMQGDHHAVHCCGTACNTRRESGVQCTCGNSIKDDVVDWRAEHAGKQRAGHAVGEQKMLQICMSHNAGEQRAAHAWEAMLRISMASKAQVSIPDSRGQQGTE